MPKLPRPIEIAAVRGCFGPKSTGSVDFDRRRDLGLERTAGFLVLETDLAPQLVQSLRNRNILVDARGKALRLGPAPYLTMRQLDDAMGVLGQCVQELALG